jgi:hypothetical protein
VGATCFVSYLMNMQVKTLKTVSNCRQPECYSQQNFIWQKEEYFYTNQVIFFGRNLRQQMGHQKEDMIMSASFAGSLENISYVNIIPIKNVISL